MPRKREKMAPGSRRSVRSSTPIPMPVIAEHENSDPRAGATTPTVPPRSPHRRASTRSSSYMGSGSTTNSSSLYPGPLIRPSLSRASSVPQYIPRRVPGLRAVGGEVGSVRSIPLNSSGSERWVVPPPATVLRDGAPDGSPRPLPKEKRKSVGDGTGIRAQAGKDNTDRALGGWVRRRGGWYRVVGVLGILIICLIVGLAVGLTVGLKKG